MPLLESIENAPEVSWDSCIDRVKVCARAKPRPNRRIRAEGRRYFFIWVYLTLNHVRDGRMYCHSTEEAALRVTAPRFTVWPLLAVRVIVWVKLDAVAFITSNISPSKGRAGVVRRMGPVR